MKDILKEQNELENKESNDVLALIADIEEMSQLWGLSESRIKALCQQGKVAAVKKGTMWILDKRQSNPKKYRI